MSNLLKASKTVAVKDFVTGYQIKVPTGSFQITIYRWKAKGMLQGQLENFEVTEKRKGHGTELFKLSCEIALGLGLNRLMIMSEETNEAIGFWNRMSEGVVSQKNWAWLVNL